MQKFQKKYRATEKLPLGKTTSSLDCADNISLRIRRAPS